MTSPRYIAFEGSEGCGKSTHASRLASSLDAVLTRETGGTAIGERLRSILHDVEVDDLDARAETLIVAADRAQHLAQVVRPALASGRHVVSDRSVYSSLAYQGAGRQLGMDEVLRVNSWAVGDTLPDLVVLIAVPAEEMEIRLRKRDLDRFERAGADFHRRVAEGFAELAERDPARWVVIDGLLPKDEVESIIRSVVLERLGL